MPDWSGFFPALAIAVALPIAAVAVEPTEDFIRELQARGLSELALDYLELMKTSQAVDDEFREKIPYHRGVVLIEQSRQATDPATRTRLLDAARAELEQFAKSNPDNVKGAEANLELASVQLLGGQQLVAQMNQLSTEPAFDAQRRTFGADARTMFANARSLFEQAEAIYSAEVEKLPPATSEAGDASNKRQEYRARIAQLRFLAAQSKFEMAQTHSPDADEFRELNESAAAELATVYEEFSRTFIVGLYARLYEGRCYQAVESYPLALGCYEELLKQSNTLPPFRKLIASAVHRKAEVLIAQEKYDAAIDACNKCLRDAKADEEKQPEWLAVRFRLADALRKKSDAPETAPLDQRRLTAEARDHYRVIAKTPGEYQMAARSVIAELAKGGSNGNSGGEKDQPKTFQAAYDLGKDALASYNAAKLALPSAEKNNPDAMPELKAQMQQGKENARRNFRAATSLVDDDTDPKLLNEVRYFLCWLYWESADYYRAAVLGEFLARRFPDHPAAASAAKLAMASYERLYSQAASATGKANDANTDFEAARMADMAEFITRRWPGSDDADAAQSVLVSLAIRNNRIEDAEKLLAAASEVSRPRLELQLGNSMWGRFLELSHANGQSDADSLAKLKESAIKYLRSGFEAARDEPEPSESTAAAGLYLAQALLSEEKYDEATELLEDEKVGPLTLIKKQHPAASRPAYAVEAYKAALRAYVLSSPPNEEKALASMKSLDDAVAASGGSGEQLTQIYIGLGMALSKQAAQLREAGRNEDAARINAAFAQFLDRIAARQENANWPTRAWLAQTYYNMGTSERAGPSSAPQSPLDDQERAYLAKARDAYQQLIADAAADPKLPPSETSVLAARMQLGECLRALGEYKLALDTFSAVLKERESSLEAQKAAAKTYQERGQAEGPQWYENAIHGGYRLKSTGQNRIWGWLKISQVAARAARSNEKYRDMFFEARYNVARCRYLAALKNKGEERKRDLAKAKQSIQSVAQVYPDLGGDHWRGEFDAVLKQIQLASGQKPSGLNEFSTSQSPTKAGQSG
jgi:tetratricopeptide (TPR) repeat protein